jgi:hypothetical protein
MRGSATVWLLVVACLPVLLTATAIDLARVIARRYPAVHVTLRLHR